MLLVAGLAGRHLAAAPPPPAEAGPAVSLLAAAELPRAVRQAAARAVVVNVWATWCVPCREEFGDLLKLRRSWPQQDLALVLVSADFDDRLAAVKWFLRARGVDFPSYLKQGDDQAFIDALTPRWSGALPATFVFDAAGQLRAWWEGKADFARFDEAVREALAVATPAPAGGR